MKRWALAVLVAGFSLGCATAHNYLDPEGPRYERNGVPRPDRPVPSSLRVVTFNIEYARRMDRAVPALRDHAALRGADLVLLQEMDLSGVEAVAALGLNYAYFPSSRHPKTGRDFGVAVLSPWPIEKAWKVPLPHRTRLVGLARAAVAARVRIGDRTVRVYSLHLGSPFGLGPGARRDQAAAVLADAKDSPDPVVIGGDTNSRGVGRTFVAAGYVWPTEKIGGTRGRFSFDHVFARGLARSAAGAGVARDVVASDHRPVWAVLAFEPPPDAAAAQRGGPE
jgi:endonuclease/exonuclease/phosphatase family metal-dependent hydrolase